MAAENASEPHRVFPVEPASMRPRRMAAENSAARPAAATMRHSFNEAAANGRGKQY